jgi:aminopeptidase YwaD
MERRMLVLLALALLLAGCGSEEPASGNAPDTTRQDTARPAETTARSEETTAAPDRGAPKKRSPEVAEVVASEIDGAAIRTNLARLTGVSPAPLPGGEVTIAERGSVDGRRMTAAYLRASFEEAGIPARVVSFDSASGPGFNVEATLRGTEGGRHLWITAHLDSVYNAGANDNASGLVLILLTARVLERLDLKHTVHFVAYDLEEVGRIGSSVYVQNTVNPIRQREGARAIIGNLNADMVSYEADEFNAVLGDCGQAGPIDDAILRAADRLDSPIVLGEYCLGRSDHQSFWDAGLPALVLTDGTRFDGYPWYHTPSDTMDKLNIAYLRAMIQLVATAGALLAVPENPG